MSILRLFYKKTTWTKWHGNSAKLSDGTFQWLTEADAGKCLDKVKKYFAESGTFADQLGRASKKRCKNPRERLKTEKQVDMMPDEKEVHIKSKIHFTSQMARY